MALYSGGVSPQGEDVAELGTMDGPVLVFGGAYSNLHALEAMLTVARDLGIPAERTIHTGDVVAYCAHALESTAMLKDSGVHCLMGNCEESVGTGALDCGCGFEPDTACSRYSENWYAHIMEELEGAGHLKEWMGSRPRFMTFGVGGRRFGVVHGSPSQIAKFMWPTSSDDELRAELDVLPPGLDGVISGHSGIPFCRFVSNAANGREQLWLNAGVIGMPANDGTQRGWYALLTPRGPNGLEISIRGLGYDAPAAAKAIHERKNLDRGYGDALIQGIWPAHDSMPLDQQLTTGMPLEEYTTVWPVSQCVSKVSAESNVLAMVVGATVAATMTVFAIHWSRRRQQSLVC